MRPPGSSASRPRAVDRPVGEARYGRMFPELNGLGTDPGVLRRAGRGGGVCDAAAALDHPAPAGDDATEAAGWPFFGQLVAHDITADRSQAERRGGGDRLGPSAYLSREPGWTPTLPHADQSFGMADLLVLAGQGRIS